VGDACFRVADQRHLIQSFQYQEGSSRHEECALAGSSQTR
jgi:hypothetical protein